MTNVTRQEYYTTIPFDENGVPCHLREGFSSENLNLIMTYVLKAALKKRNSIILIAYSVSVNVEVKDDDLHFSLLDTTETHSHSVFFKISLSGTTEVVVNKMATCLTKTLSTYKTDRP